MKKKVCLMHNCQLYQHGQSRFVRLERSGPPTLKPVVVFAGLGVRVPCAISASRLPGLTHIAVLLPNDDTQTGSLNLLPVRYTIRRETTSVRPFIIVSDKRNVSFTDRYRINRNMHLSLIKESTYNGCEKCIEGSTYSSSIGSELTCLPCSKCPEDAKIVRRCNITHDTVCVCGHEQMNESYISSVNEAPTALDRSHLFLRMRFLSADTKQCKLCDLCSAGWGASRPCGDGFNTMCNRCPQGTFSDRLHATAPCLKCRRCKRGLKVLRTCSTTRNTVCLKETSKHTH